VGSAALCDGNPRPGNPDGAALAWLAWQHAQPTRRDRLGATAWRGPRHERLRGLLRHIYHLTGNPFEWAATLERWGYFPGGAPWTAPVNLVRHLVTHPYRFLTTDPMAPYDSLYGVTGILFALAIPFVWRRFGAAYGLFMLVNLWLPLSSGVFEGVGRTARSCFPASSGWRRSARRSYRMRSSWGLRCSTLWVWRSSRRFIRSSDVRRASPL
jgi:hypothetical protein